MPNEFRAYPTSPKEGSCYVSSSRNSCCEFHASDGSNLQADYQPFLKTPVCGAPFCNQIICSEQQILKGGFR